AWTRADAVARACYAHYEQRLPKRGKPAEGREWTLLAAVLEAAAGDPGPGMTKLVAMGTGTKCIGQSQMRNTGKPGSRPARLHSAEPGCGTLCYASASCKLGLLH
uniref:Uncharacterized protein n=1 Tax=Varanus komodoensis TaxID=61221 RepID=A0A8D2LFQ4_VARKO